MYLHCDAKTPRSEVLARMQAREPRVRHLTEARHPARELVPGGRRSSRGVRAALRTTARLRHIAVLSGADYPLLTMGEVVHMLRAVASDRSFIYNRPLPFDKLEHATGTVTAAGGARVTACSLAATTRSRSGAGSCASRFPGQLPRGLELRASSQWKIYCTARTRSDCWG